MSAPADPLITGAGGNGYHLIVAEDLAPEPVAAKCLAAVSHSVKPRAMKALFTASLVCSVASLSSLVGLSAMTVVPGVETWRRGMSSQIFGSISHAMPSNEMAE